MRFIVLSPYSSIEVGDNPDEGEIEAPVSDIPATTPTHRLIYTRCLQVCHAKREIFLGRTNEPSPRRNRYPRSIAVRQGKQAYPHGGSTVTIPAASVHPHDWRATRFCPRSAARKPTEG